MGSLSLLHGSVQSPVALSRVCVLSVLVFVYLMYVNVTVSGREKGGGAVGQRRVHS